MSKNQPKNLDRIFAEGTAIDRALSRAMREAVLRHKEAGHPVATWQNGKVVWISPANIKVDGKRKVAKGKARRSSVGA